jgi:hypothetical protein
LFKPPYYPGNGAAADARRWLAWKVGIDRIEGVAFYANPDSVLKEAIKNYGESIIAGKAPNGRAETMRQLYERTLGSWSDEPKLKRGTPKRQFR